MAKGVQFQPEKYGLVLKVKGGPTYTFCRGAYSI
jgi:hypothetical protein